MTGWEGTDFTGYRYVSQTSWDAIKNQIFDGAVNDLGLNRIRLEIPSGVENNIDYYTQWLNGQIAEDQWTALSYKVVNDNNDPNSINPSGFQWASVDDKVNNILLPLKQRLQARGEQLYVNVQFVDFKRAATGTSYQHKNNPAEYAELVLATYQHLQTAFGITPDSWEIILEPDTTSASWSASQTANAIKATGDILVASGYVPKLIAPSVTNAGNVASYVTAIANVSGAMQYVDTFSYHRYAGLTSAQATQIKNLGSQYGKKTAMLEFIGADYLMLHQDLKDVNNSAWQQFTISSLAEWGAGDSYFDVYNDNTIQLETNPKYLRQYFKYIRFGATRIEATNTGNPFIDPLAFKNVDGKFVVVSTVVGSPSPVTFGVNGLPSGTYGIFYTSGDVTTELPAQTIVSGNAVNVTLPTGTVGVVTVYSVSSQNPTNTPTFTPTAATSTPTRTNTATPTPTSTSTAVPSSTPTASSTATASPTPPTSFTCDYYASTTGSASGSGTISSPWNLHTALNKTTLVVAGKTLCVQAGVYNGKFKSTLNGGTVRGLGGVVIDGYVFSPLSSAITATQTSIPVADASIFVTAWQSGSVNSLIVDGEALFINDISGNTISVNRAAAGSSTAALSHTAGTPVRLAGNQLLVTGSNTVYRDIEIMNSDPLRNWNTDGAEGLRGAGVTNVGNGNKFVNLNVHDNLIGIFCSSASSNSELTGNVIYNNGMFTDTDKGAGHGLYLENASGYSRVYDNIVLNNFALGAQLYGRTAAYPGGDIQGNVLANSGSPLGYDLRHYNLLVGTETQRLTDILIQNNFLFHPHNLNGYNMIFGYGAGADNGSVLSNYFVGGGAIGLEVTDATNVTATGNKFYTANSSAINIQSHQASYTVNNNTYYGTAANSAKYGNITAGENQTFTQWRSSTGFDAASTTNSNPLPDTVILRPNTYSAGRANIVVFAPSAPASITVNLTQAGLANGQAYTIQNAYNYNGTPVFSGVYNSAAPSISIPLNGSAASVVTPVGSSYTPPTTSPHLAVFVVVPR